MHPAIALYPSRRFYGSLLRSAGVVSTRAPPPGLAGAFRRLGLDYGAGGPVAFLDVRFGAERAVGTSFANDAEAEACAACVAAFLAQPRDAETTAAAAVTTARGAAMISVAVVAPYNAQVLAMFIFCLCRATRYRLWSVFLAHEAPALYFLACMAARCSRFNEGSNLAV